MVGLDGAYDLEDTEAARAHYDAWAETYDAELKAAGYVTPERCATALASFAEEPEAPVLELGCGTGLGGVALRAAGFTCIDGFDISEEMLAVARTRTGIYRKIGKLDLSGPFDSIEPDSYGNAAAIGVLNPAYMPPTVLDEVLARLRPDGCFVYSLNDHSAADRSFDARLGDLIEYRGAELVFKEHGEHLPGTGLMSTVYVVRKI